MADCIFCKIVSGAIPSVRVYEDDQVLSFLDINPISPGHTLVVPKRHVEWITELSAEETAALFRPLPMLAKAVLSVTKAEGFNILENNGRISGQVIPHVHVHVIPRRANDGLGYRWAAKPADPAELQSLQVAIREALGSLA